MVPSNGIELSVTEAGDGPLVVLAHGFPELGYSWRHQVEPLAAAGYRVVAPDQRGYGRSTAPARVGDYDIVHLTDDLVGLLDALGEDSAVFVGHDWGSIVVSHQAALHPERVRGLVNMSVPYLPRGAKPPVRAMREAFGDNFFYILYFQDRGPADSELAADPDRTMRRLLGGARADGALTDPTMFANDGRGFVERMADPGALPEWLTQAELDHYVGEFSRTGFTGGLNWYRNLDRNWEITPQLDGAQITAPSLFIGGSLDPVLAMTPPSVGHAALADHRGDVLVPGAGHWVQQEAPGAVNDALIHFLDIVHGRTT